MNHKKQEILSDSTTPAEEQCAKEAERKIKLEEFFSSNLCYIEKIDQRYYHCSLDTFEGGEDVVELCKDFVSNPKVNLILSGSFGSGKTHLSVGIVRGFMLHHGYTYNDIIFVYVPELFVDFREAKDFKNNLTEDYLIRKFSNVKLLVLDDLGVGVLSDERAELIGIIINKRYGKKYPTVITTNMSMDELKEHFGGHIVGRLNEGITIKINMPNYRKKLKNKSKAFDVYYTNF